MSIVKKFFNVLVFNKTIVYIAIAILVVAGGVAVLSNKSENGKEETLVVQRGEFLQQVSVSGKVVAAQNVDLGFTQSGRISRVYATVGQTVAAGAILVEIDNGDARAALLQKQAALEAELATLHSLELGTRPEELAVSEAEVESAEAALAQANQGVVDAIMDAYSTSDDAIHNKLDQFFSNPKSSNPQLDLITTNIQLEAVIETKRAALEDTLAAWQVTISTLSATADLSLAIAGAQKNLADVSALLANAASILNNTIPSGSNTQTVINGYIADITTARSAVNSAISALTTAETTRKSKIAALNTAQKNLALKRAGSLPTDIEAQKAQVKAAEAGVADARAGLQKTFLTAPFRGVVTRVDAKAGKIVSPNTAEVSMIGTDAYQVESYVPEINISFLKVGNEAMVTLDAYGDAVPFAASIIAIDPAETIRDGVSTYRAIIRFAEQDQQIKQGMTANVVITTEKKSGVISIPQGIVMERGGKKYVLVKQGEEGVEREVMTGSVSSLGSIEITAGLSEGDVVILSIPE